MFGLSFDCLLHFHEVVKFGSGFGVCSGLQKYLNQQGFHIVGYGCTTCIGNSGDLDESVASAISENGIFAKQQENVKYCLYGFNTQGYKLTPPYREQSLYHTFSEIVTMR